MGENIKKSPSLILTAEKGIKNKEIGLVKQTKGT